MCNLRFDDTNPSKEDVEYVDAIKADVRWLGLRLGLREYLRLRLLRAALRLRGALIEDGKAYVDCSPPRRSASTAARHERGRSRARTAIGPIAESLDLFARMRAGEFAEGAHVLRAKIDMASRQHEHARPDALPHPQRATHHRTGDDWCVYPMYDYAHPLSDAIEGITHSLCSLEFEDHRPLYDWLLDHTDAPSRRADRVRAPRDHATPCCRKRKLLPPGRARASLGLGRPAHADALRAAPARLHARGDPRLLRTRRGHQGTSR